MNPSNSRDDTFEHRMSQVVSAIKSLTHISNTPRTLTFSIDHHSSHVTVVVDVNNSKIFQAVLCPQFVDLLNAFNCVDRHAVVTRIRCAFIIRFVIIVDDSLRKRRFGNRSLLLAFTLLRYLCAELGEILQYCSLVGSLQDTHLRCCLD